MSLDILSLHKIFSPPSPRLIKTRKIFAKNCAIGGTFDKLHYGHQAFISAAFNIAKHVHVCIMSDEGVKKWGRKEYSDKIDGYDVRLHHVLNYLKAYDLIYHAIICSINDPFSYAVKGETAKKLDSILVSMDKLVLERTMKLNEMRVKRSLSPLHIFRMPLLVDKEGKPFSSTRIRAGERIYVPDIPTYKLDVALIDEVREPKGIMIDSPEDLPKPKNAVIAIGDVVIKNLAKYGYPVSIAIVDMTSRREKLEDYFIYLKSNESVTDIPIYIPVRNPRGVVTQDSWTKIALALFQREPVVLRVYGEEDLMGFPATILAPNGTLLIYGQPPPYDKMVYFYVDDEHRLKAYNLLTRMIPIVY